MWFSVFDIYDELKFLRHLYDNNGEITQTTVLYIKGRLNASDKVIKSLNGTDLITTYLVETTQPLKIGDLLCIGTNTYPVVDSESYSTVFGDPAIYRGYTA